MPEQTAKCFSVNSLLMSWGIGISIVFVILGDRKSLAFNVAHSLGESRILSILLTYVGYRNDIAALESVSLHSLNGLIYHMGDNLVLAPETEITSFVANLNIYMDARMIL